MFNIFRRLLNPYPIQTFTYFIPAPPERKQGYREKSFDRLVEKLTKLDFELIDIKTQAINNNSKSGMWVIVELRAKSKKAYQLDISDFPNEEETEGLQNLAHFPVNNDNFNYREKEKSLTELHRENSIELPELQEDEKSEKIEGIYYID